MDAGRYIASIEFSLIADVAIEAAQQVCATEDAQQLLKAGAVPCSATVISVNQNRVRLAIALIL
jgi:hypothetical protein